MTFKSQWKSLAWGRKRTKAGFAATATPGSASRIDVSPSRLPASLCSVCGTSTESIAPVDHVPDEVLDMYLAKRRREGLFVNLFAFLGIFLALLLSAAVWFLTPDNLWKILPFVILGGGSYYLARVLGYNAGVPAGRASGNKLRDRRWSEFVQRRESEPGES